jgi:hypothetical protein
MLALRFARATLFAVIWGVMSSSCSLTDSSGIAPLARMASMSADRSVEHQSSFTSAADNGWVTQKSTSEDLLYVVDQHEVTIYTYPEGKLVDKLKNKNLYLATGACVDTKGDVYVADYGTSELFEYRHGEKKLLRTIHPPAGATGCSVDPATGNLAVAGNGGLSVYQDARGTPTVYTDPAFEAYYYCGYDGEGNAFVDGYSQPGSGHGIVAELPKGGSALQTISLDQVIQWPGEIQWDGKHVAVGDDGGPSESNGVIYRFSVFGSEGTEVGKTTVNRPGELHQTWIQGGVLLVPAHCWPESCYGSSVLFYRYPKGGNAFKKLTNDVRGPLAAVVSPGQ